MNTPDAFLEAVVIAASYERNDLKDRFRMDVYPHLSGYTGGGRLIGFDDAAYHWEKHGMRNPDPAFAVTGLRANPVHHETLSAAIRYFRLCALAAMERHVPLRRGS
jgi:hypothetical protein